MRRRTRIRQFFCRHSWAYFEEKKAGEIRFWKQCPYCMKHVRITAFEYAKSMEKP